MLPQKLPGRCLCPRCEETPALRRLFPQTPRHSSRVTLPNWCSETKSEDTSHSVWWTKTGNKLNAHKLRWKYGTNVNTNHDLVTWPYNIHVDADSRQIKLHPELEHQLLTSVQTQYFNEGGNFRHNPKIRVHCTTLVDNDVLENRVVPISHDQKSPHYLPLSLHFCWTHGISLIIQHFPAWRLQPQTLVAGKMFAALEVSQNFLVTMSHYRDARVTNAATETARFCRNICVHSHKKLPNITGLPFFFILNVLLYRNRRRGLPLSQSSPLVTLVLPNRGTPRNDLCSTYSNRLETTSNPVNSKCAWNIWRTERNIMSVSKKLFWTTDKRRKRKQYMTKKTSNTN